MKKVIIILAVIVLVMGFYKYKQNKKAKEAEVYKKAYKKASEDALNKGKDDLIEVHGCFGTSYMTPDEYKIYQLTHALGPVGQSATETVLPDAYAPEAEHHNETETVDTVQLIVDAAIEETAKVVD